MGACFSSRSNSTSRTGRDNQRYVDVDADENQRVRQIVGTIPFKYKQKRYVVLIISTQKKGKGWLFPKGGWENDENIFEAAARETREEAGVEGDLGVELGVYNHKGKAEVHMFPLHFTGDVDWPEQNIRSRKWVSVVEARKSLCHDYMKKALSALVSLLGQDAVPGSNNFEVGSGSNPSAAGQVFYENQGTYVQDDAYIGYYHQD